MYIYIKSVLKCVSALQKIPISTISLYDFGKITSNFLVGFDFFSHRIINLYRFSYSFLVQFPTFNKINKMWKRKTKDEENSIHLQVFAQMIFSLKLNFTVICCYIGYKIK